MGKKNKTDSKHCFNNYANIYSNVTCPLVANEGQKFNLTNTNTLDWEIFGTRLICKNEGVWNFSSSFNVNVIGIDSSTTSGAPPAYALVGYSVFYNINGNILQNCIASATLANAPGNIWFLEINTTQNFKKNDYIEFLAGCFSSYTALSLNSKSRMDESGVWDPALSISAVKIKS